MEERLDKDIASLKDRIVNDKAFPLQNRKATETYYSFMKAKGVSKKTILKNLYCWKRFLKLLPKSLRLKSAKKVDIEKAIARIEEESISPATKQNIKVVVKSFYKHYKGEDYFYPKEVAWIPTSMQRGKKILPTDLLSETDILHMLENAPEIRDKCVIALLYDTGVRVGELINIKKKDVELDSNPAHVVVSGKTGMRKIPLFFSKPYVAQYLNTIKDYEPSDNLFCDYGAMKRFRRPIGRDGVAKMIRIVGKKAGITKPVNPHSFRHARASFYANKLTEQQLKHYFGWSGSSAMASVYVHLSGRDIDSAILQANGEKEAEKTTEPKLKIKTCPSCREPNGIDFQYCSRCGSPLDISVAMQQEKDKELLFNRLSAALKDEKDFRKFIETIKQRKGKA